MKRLLEDFTAMHEGEYVYRGRYGVKDEGKTFPEGGAPGHPHASCIRQERAARTARFHDADRPALAA